MSPVPRLGRKISALLGVSLVFTMAFLAAFATTAAAQEVPAGGAEGGAGGEGNQTGGNETAGNQTGGNGAGGGASGSDLGVPADAPQPAEGRITRVMTVGVIDENCPGGIPAPCWDVSTFVANPGDVVVLHGNLLNSAGIHNIHVTEGVEGAPKTRLAPNALHTVSFTMPESGEVTFICDAHADTMIANVLTPAAAASTGGGHSSVPAMGVHFLAYWVGVIAFAILFIVYGATFFIFKYNETNATTDHWDRSGADGENKKLGNVASLLAVVIAVVAIGAIIFLATR